MKLTTLLRIFIWGFVFSFGINIYCLFCINMMDKEIRYNREACDDLYDKHYERTHLLIDAGIYNKLDN